MHAADDFAARIESVDRLFILVINLERSARLETAQRSRHAQTLLDDVDRAIRIQTHAHFRAAKIIVFARSHHFVEMGNGCAQLLGIDSRFRRRLFNGRALAEHRLAASSHGATISGVRPALTSIMPIQLS